MSPLILLTNVTAGTKHCKRDRNRSSPDNDPKTGIVIDESHPLFGKSVAGKVLVFPYGKGSTVGSYVLYALAKNHVAPAAIINTECETIIATGAIIAEIPTVDRLKGDLPTDGVVTVDGTRGTVSFA